MCTSYQVGGFAVEKDKWASFSKLSRLQLKYLHAFQRLRSTDPSSKSALSVLSCMKVLYHDKLQLGRICLENTKQSLTTSMACTLPRACKRGHFWPSGIIGEDGREQTGQVSTHAAFDSPDTLANATGFLRQYAIDTAAQAAVAIVPKHKIAFPQVIAYSC